jgi:DNA polymerase (family 10)
VTNKEIIKTFRTAAVLAELYGDEAKPYYSAVFNIEKISAELQDKDPSEMKALGLTAFQAKSVYDLLHTGTFSELKEYLDKTPLGVVDMLVIKGLGGKKVGQLWREHGIDSIQSLKSACQSGLLAEMKGFGLKSQEAILHQIGFLLTSSEKKHLNQAEKIGMELLSKIQARYSQAIVVGQIRRWLPVVDKLEILAVADQQGHSFISQLEGAVYQINLSGPFVWRGKYNSFDLEVHFCLEKNFAGESLLLSSSPQHLSHFDLWKQAKTGVFQSEEAIYQSVGLPYFPPELREGQNEFEFERNFGLGQIIEYKDLKGILHSHSTYSDGRHSLREMAVTCRDLGFEYLGISDHSQSAFYAGGLNPTAIERQHHEIDSLNLELAPFKILKGIESDILNDGSLDYEESVLERFDFIIASIHSGLSMSEAKASARLIKAIENPYTSILGHPTGRLLLKREGYPIDHKAVIDACAQYSVAIEINSHPWRLDLDWKWVQYAVSKGVMIAICPDAHEKEAYAYMELGLRMARKGCLPKSLALNALSLPEIERFFAQQKRNKK